MLKTKRLSFEQWQKGDAVTQARQARADATEVAQAVTEARERAKHHAHRAARAIAAGCTINAASAREQASATLAKIADLQRYASHLDRLACTAEAVATKVAVTPARGAVTKSRPLAAAPAPVAYQPTDLSRALAAEWRRRQAARAERPAATEPNLAQQRAEADRIWDHVNARRAGRP